MKKLCLLLALMLLMGSVTVNGALAMQADPMAVSTPSPSSSFSLPEGYGEAAPPQILSNPSAYSSGTHSPPRSTASAFPHGRNDLASRRFL